MDQFLLAMAFTCAAAGGIATAVLLVRERQITARLRRRITKLTEGVQARDDELRHLVQNRLPELMELLHDRPVTVSGPRHARVLVGTEYEHCLRKVLDYFAESVSRTKDRADLSAKATLRAMMRTVQSLANEQQLAISDMQGKHDDPYVLADLLKIDHMNAQLGRRAQVTAVLCGSWPGQQRSASTLSDVVRGATSRIRDYLRIKVHATIDIAVVSRAVEPVVLTLAELLDNAARHSPPTTPVEVSLRSTHNGVAIMIDDAGVAMDTEELQKAARLLPGQVPVNIYQLGDPPQVGFATAGILAARYGFTVSVDTRSPYGGARAVVFLPAALLCPVPRELAGNGAGPSLSAAAPRSVSVTGGGLPRRRRVQPTERVSTTERSDQPARPPRETAAGMGAWQRGTRSGRAAMPDAEGRDIQP